MVYIYDSQADTFKPLPDMPEDLPQQILHANEALTRVAAGQPVILFFLVVYLEESVPFCTGPS